ncbi:MAG: DNA-3-methyladenine glycosylase 2 [Burkholderiales bacterium]|nr:DNA-3-methyladenine glycosylase 2 [Burkholderiales bacterium]OUT77550.1 MAG: hypothetical protein CBB82_05220 [Betaproteobacteria bacterium TMED22]|tara:strand:+ start:26941 stop:27825 length:885 start_codon:yes stop_codon:yes gene_type:complete
MTAINLTISLPENYRIQEVLQYYGRDQTGSSEKAGKEGFEKALWIKNCPAYFAVHFRGIHADIEASVDARLKKEHLKLLVESVVLRVLGLSQPVAEFESIAFADRVLRRMVRKTKGLRVPQAVSAWEALVGSIIGQQVSVVAATAMRSRFIKGLGVPHSSGLHCFPNPVTIAALNVDELRKFGMSFAKASTIHRLATSIDSGAFSLNEVSTSNYFEILSRDLLCVKGVGPWTVNYTLLRGYAFLDGSLHGDVVIRKRIQQLLKKSMMSAGEVEQWLAQYRPWRGLLAAHLWAMS